MPNRGSVLGVKGDGAICNGMQALTLPPRRPNCVVKPASNEVCKQFPNGTSLRVGEGTCSRDDFVQCSPPCVGQAEGPASGRRQRAQPPFRWGRNLSCKKG